MKTQQTHLVADGKNSLNSSESIRHLAPKTLHVLYVGPLDGTYAIYETLCEAPGLRFSVAVDYHAVWLIQRPQSIDLAILHSSLSNSEIDDLTRYLRRKWPHVRILLIRDNAEFLDDALYDERLPSCTDANVLLTVLSGLLPGSPSLKLQAASPSS